MLASTDFHTITRAMNASVNLTLYDDWFTGLLLLKNIDHWHSSRRFYA